MLVSWSWSEALMESFDPTFHPTNLSIRGITRHHHSDWRADKHQVNGTIQHQLDGLTSTHNPSVAGSIPARPTTSPKRMVFLHRGCEIACHLPSELSPISYTLSLAVACPSGALRPRRSDRPFGSDAPRGSVTRSWPWSTSGVDAHGPNNRDRLVVGGTAHATSSVTRS